MAYNKYLSDTPILVAFTGWCITGGIAALTGPLKGIRRLVICSAVYMAPWVGGGADVPLVNILKHIFRRIRPSAIAHTTFAFPSGCVSIDHSFQRGSSTLTGGITHPHPTSTVAACLTHIIVVLQAYHMRGLPFRSPVLHLVARGAEPHG